MYQKYDTYKDSGVQWLGNIPNDWEVVRFRDICTFSKGLNITKENLQDTGIPCVNYGEVHSKYGFEVSPERNELKCVSEDYLKSSPKSLLAYGDFIFADTSEDIDGSGNFTYLNSHVMTFAGYHTVIVRPKSYINVRYLAYVFDSLSFRHQIRTAVKGVKVYSITKAILKDTTVWLPDLDQQYEIAQFLDQKTTQIDQAIAIKEQQIALLNERKQIVIQQAVTKGLDPNVKMKDSGVEWIGEIPEHWFYEPIKYSLKGIIDCEHKTAPFVDEKEYFVVRTSNVKNGKLLHEGAKYTHEKGYKEWTKRGIPRCGDILLTREAPAGEACLIPNDLKLCLGQRMVWLKVNNDRMLSQLIIYLIYSTVVRTYIDFLSTGSTVLHFNMADIQNIPILIPPIDEQKLIVKYLNKLDLDIEGASEKIKLQIQKLKEYKTTLINDAVTGKIKVA
ncbi:restriction endonuclease subunit S [Acinetobacter junii]|uniref:restriction endonuclease subunit S n=1 Tax=Acinetobacter junii TaxID=40215 RepID=UPI00286DA10F|nr:restriction endonuclease subunit S [Acinetobacter junii]